MSMTTDQSSRLLEARALAATLDKLSRNPRRFSPTAPWIIPATMVVVGAFALICIAIKLIMNYLNSKNMKTEVAKNRRTHPSSPEIPTTPDQDQTSMATTASMKTRGGSLRLNQSRQHKSRPPPVSLYQIKQKQSPGSAGSSKSKTQRAAMKAMARAARADANRGISRDNSRQNDEASDDNSNNVVDDSPDLSQRSIDITDEMQTVNQTGLVYGASASRGDETDGAHSSVQPEVHIVQIRDLDEGNLQHSQPTWEQTESDI